VLRTYELYFLAGVDCVDGALAQLVAGVSSDDRDGDWCRTTCSCIYRR
jgi:hypothetical protein